MSRTRLAPVIDLHTGGEDNIFPHHECEIAQSYGARDHNHEEAPVNFCRYWVHARHLLVNGAKMSKRDGTLITVKALLNPDSATPTQLTSELQQAGFTGGRVPAAVLRLALIATPFTQPMNFTVDVLMQVKAGVERLQSLYTRLEHIRGRGPGPVETPAAEDVRVLIERGTAQFDAALDENLNMSKALAAMFQVVSSANRRELSAADAVEVKRFLEHCDDIFAVLDRAADSGTLSNSELESEAAASSEADRSALPQLLVERFTARRSGDFARADAIRQQLTQLGVEIEDTRDGVRWRRL
jgi:cysteinyl-tRNA synthetase